RVVVSTMPQCRRVTRVLPSRSRTLQRRGCSNGSGASTVTAGAMRRPNVSRFGGGVAPSILRAEPGRVGGRTPAMEKPPERARWPCPGVLVLGGPRSADRSGHRLADVRRRLGDPHARVTKRFELGFGGAFATRDDRTRVTHALAGRGRGARDEADDRLPHVLLDERGAVLFGTATDLADHDDALGLGVFVEQLEAVDEVGAVDR